MEEGGVSGKASPRSPFCAITKPGGRSPAHRVRCGQGESWNRNRGFDQGSRPARRGCFRPPAFAAITTSPRGVTV
jgi:hypothetical protein